MASIKKLKELRNVYQIKISLRGIRPPIWRRLEVFSDTTLDKLHLIFQLAMGWANYHLHQFTIGGEEYGQSDPDNDLEVNDEKIRNTTDIWDVIENIDAKSGDTLKLKIFRNQKYMIVRIKLEQYPD